MRRSAGDGPSARPPEERLDALREEALREGRVEGKGVRAAGGPLPLRPGRRDRGGAPPGGGGPVSAARDPGGHLRPPRAGAPGYYGLPVLKAPVWTWEIPAYFFVGGLAGMAAVLALAATATGVGAALEGAGPRGALVRTALGLAAGGALLSALLLVLDLGRPARFLNMLRVFKWRSPMSVGAWTLALFGGAALAALLLLEASVRAGSLGAATPWVEAAVLLSILAAGASGAVLATYTGVLVAATSVPAWFLHRRLLPLHFGVAGLGSAAAALELLGLRLLPLHAIGLLAAGVETGLGLATELRRHGPADRALREGRSGLLLRVASALSGPAALLLRLLGWIPAAAGSFLLGALLSRFGWLEAGRASARDPEATFASQGLGS